MRSDFLTVGQISRHTGVPLWKIRSAVDRLDGIPRAGLYRLVPRSRLPEVEALLGLGAGR